MATGSSKAHVLLNRHVLLDVVRFLTPADVLLLTETSKALRDVLDSQYDFWTHCASIEPICVRHIRRLKLNPQLHINRHFCVWHCHVWSRITRATAFTYLLTSVAPYVFATGLVCATFRRVGWLAEDEEQRYAAHKMQLHIMIAQHLLSTQLEDVDELRAGLDALKVLSRPFTTIEVNPDLFQVANPSFMQTQVVTNAMVPAECVLKALTLHKGDVAIVESAVLACTNLALRRIFALYLASEGLVTLLTQVVCGDGRMTARDALVCGAANALRNAYDVLSISPDHLDQVLAFVLHVLRARAQSLDVVEHYVGYLVHLSAWQAALMQSHELRDVLADVVARSEEGVGAAGSTAMDVDVDAAAPAAVAAAAAAAAAAGAVVGTDGGTQARNVNAAAKALLARLAAT
jgi:hypothetical protein